MRKIILTTSIFLASFFHIYAFEADLSVDKNHLNINDTFLLQLKISDLEKDLNLGEIKWIENFSIISKWTSQRSSSKTVIINWKNERKSNTIITINYTLKAKEKWDFVIWPVILSSLDWDKETNTVKIKIDAKKIIPSKTLWKSNFVNSWAKKQITNLEDYDFYDKNKKNNLIYVLSFIIFLFLVILIIIFTRNNKTVKKDEEEQKDEENLEVQDFENNEIIVFPEIDNPEFVVKLEKTLKNILQKKYKIKNDKEISDILKIENLDLEDKNNLEKFISELYKLKYSNILVSKVKLLEIAKKFKL